MTARPLRLVVLGMMGRSPFGGQTWLYLNWLQALSALGHEVYYVEDDIVWPYDPSQGREIKDFDYAVRHVSSCMERIGMGDRWAYRFELEEGACWGMTPARLDELYRSCDALLNIVGATELRETHMAAPLRVYVETDPVTMELRLAAGDTFARDLLGAHNAFATYGENYGAPDCRVPVDGMSFVKTRQPVDLDYWTMAYDPEARYFTTIGNYRQEGGDVAFDGDVYRWSKHHEWEKIVDLPRRTSQEFQLAINQPDMKRHAEDVRFLRRHGWHFSSPTELSLDVFGAYPRFFRDSRAELTVAKDQNVRLRSGWFSERDACYLATGKPVVAQDTAFSSVLPTGEGLFAFADLDEALAAVEEINGDYRRHCLAAREIAEEHFEGRRVAARLLEGIGLV